MNGIEKAVELLINGEVVAIPTETVYGLAANAADDAAIAKIYELKNRPNFNPLIIHVANLEQAEEIVEFNDKARELAKAHWPGGLTLVLPKKDLGFAKLASAGLDTLAIRCPVHPIAQEILQKSGLMLAAPSANISGRLSPTSAKHVRSNFSDIYIVDGGECEIGLESTVIGFEKGEAVLLREGVLQIELGTSPSSSYEEGNGLVALPPCRRELEGGLIVSPGMLLKHYSPKNSLRINAESPNANELFLGFGEMDCDLNLSAGGNLTEAAANLFAMLHKLDELNKPIAVAKIPHQGVGIAINDRLQRAAEK